MPDKPTGDSFEMVEVSLKGVVTESRPYEECPNCGEHKLTVRRRWVSKDQSPRWKFWTRDPDPTMVSQWRICDNCKFRPEKHDD